MSAGPSMSSGEATAAGPPPTRSGTSRTVGWSPPIITRLKELEHENGRLTRMYAALSLEHAALKDGLAKKLYGPLSDGMPWPTWSVRTAFRFSGPVGRSRTTYDRPVVNWTQRESPVIAARTTLGTTNLCWGFSKYGDRLRNTGHRWNHMRLWRVYGQLRLTLPRRTKKRLPVRPVHLMDVLPRPNVVWAAERVVRVLAQVVAWWGQPQAIRLNNGPE
jgi:hypothetical protein